MTEHDRADAELPSLSKAEWEVIQVLWDRGALPARDIYQALPEGHGWAYPTVKTLLSRLVQKGALAVDRVGNSFLYKPVYPRESLTGGEVKSFLRRVLGGSVGAFLSRFIRDSDLSTQEIERLRRLLDEKEQALGRGAGAGGNSPKKTP